MTMRQQGNARTAESARAVIYARYSTELQSDTSVDDQVRLCRDFIQRQRWLHLQVYSDRAKSGASALRPGYQQLLEDARADRFDIVVAEALDRLTRDQADTATLYKQLTFYGIKIVTLGEGEVTELHIGLKGTMNALFLKDLANKTRRGLRGRVELGRSGGGLCYGYDVVRETTADGKLHTGVRRINANQAEVVCKIFEAFASGRSPRRIAFELNCAHIPGPSNSAWGTSTINGNAARGTGILNNERYIGRLVWNRLRYVKEPVTGKRISRPNPESDWIIREVPELRLVDQCLWDRVKLRQAELRKNTRPDRSQRPFWSMVRPKYLLSGCCAAESVAAPTRRSTPTCSVVLLLGTRGLATTASTFVATRSNPLCWMD